MPMQKVKIYLEPGQKPPKGVKVQKGPKGGTYFMGTPAQKKAHEKPGAAPKEKPKVNIFNEPKGNVKKEPVSEPKSVQRRQNAPHPHDVQDREFQSMIKTNAPKSINGLHTGHIITVDQVPGAEYKVLGSVKKKGNKMYLPVKVIKHKDQNRIGQIYDAPVKPGLKFDVVGMDITPSEKQKVEREKLIKQLNATQTALDKYEMSRKDSASIWHPGGHSYADPKVVKKYQDKIKNIMDKLDKLRRENTIPNKETLIRERIRKEIKNIIAEVDPKHVFDADVKTNPTQQKLITAFKNKPKNKELVVFLKHSGKYRNLELTIGDLEDITLTKTYGMGLDPDGKHVDFKFDDVDKIKLI